MPDLLRYILMYYSNHGCCIVCGCTDLISSPLMFATTFSTMFSDYSAGKNYYIIMVVL